MAEEREQQTGEQETEADAPFDENPPVEPMSQQVGNSNARFFMPREEEAEDGGEEEREGDGEGEGHGEREGAGKSEGDS